MKRIVEVVRPGLLTTVQDLGRYGYQQYGIPVAGAMDAFSLQVGNLLVGNPRGEAALEITLSGPVLRFRTEAVIAVTGANLSPSLDGEPLPLWKSVRVGSGQVLRFGKPVAGVRSYLCFSGGIQVDRVMGSKSTYIQAKLGGMEGRALSDGDVLEIGEPPLPLERLTGRLFSPAERPVYRKHVTVRVVMGPQKEAFTEEGVETFLTARYEVTPQSNRMGYRLSGPPIRHKSSADIISEAVAPGTIQVPAEGQPIIMMADRQTVGGYTQIATVISVDLPKVAQSGPGCFLSFQEVDVERAQELAVVQEQRLRRMEVAGRG